MKWSWLVVTSVIFTFSSADLRRPRLVKDLGGGYTAAVVEFSPEAAETDPASLVTAVNLAEFIKYIEVAKSQGADIVVFPEYGMTSTFAATDRGKARDFSQKVPDPSKKEVPCETYDTIEYEAMERLSCTALANDLYVVVNLLERQDCPGCADDDLLIYNTNVVFDRSGAVVARYRKFNLFAETALNTTEEPDISYFDADFGARIGLMTCFDIMFERPAVTLVHTYNVTDVIFPTAWGQELPFLTAVQTQAAWSYSLDVKLLASGFNRPDMGSTGSGIYGGLRLGAIAAAMFESETDELIVSSIPDNKQFRSSYTPGLRNLYTKKDNLQDYMSKPVPRGSDLNTLILCHGTFCCNLTYQFEDKNQVTNYHFLVYDGIRTHAEGMYPSKLQVCALVACSGTDKTSCSDGFHLSTYSLDTQFNTLNIKSESFKSDRVWPNTLLADSVLPLDIQHFTYNKIVNSDEKNIFYTLELKESKKSIHTFGLYSHDYEKNTASSFYLSSVISLIVIVITLKQIC